VVQLRRPHPPKWVASLPPDVRDDLRLALEDAIVMAQNLGDEGLERARLRCLADLEPAPPPAVRRACEALGFVLPDSYGSITQSV
jgi:hypothetical protein